MLEEGTVFKKKALAADQHVNKPYQSEGEEKEEEINILIYTNYSQSYAIASPYVEGGGHVRGQAACWEFGGPRARRPLAPALTPLTCVAPLVRRILLLGPLVRVARFCKQRK